MNRQAHKCKQCKKAFQPRKIDQLYCSHKCRQAAYRKRQDSSKRQKQSNTTPASIPTICGHCGGSFWAKRSRAQFCSTSCRTLYHRALRAAIPDAIGLVYGLPEEKAQDILETQPIGEIRMLLQVSGFSYSHAQRRWVAQQ